MPHRTMFPQFYPVLATVLCIVSTLAAESSRAADPELRSLLNASQRVVFLGDSITFSGRYVSCFEAWLLTQELPQTPHVIDAGLPSETVSGLSEQGHAGGKFPRPDLHERLARLLALAKPDLVFACYGINCGIYQPLDEERFAKYQQGYRKLKQNVEATGAKLVVITPPFYDDGRRPGAFSYNEVLGAYSRWLLAQRDQDWHVIDLHAAMTEEVARRRAADPEFHFQRDGVHPNEAGHWFMAQQLIRACGGEQDAACAGPEEMLKQHGLPASVFPLVEQRMSLLRNAYVGTAGHKRPGVAKGLSVEAAEQQASELTAQIKTAMATKP